MNFLSDFGLDGLSVVLIGIGILLVLVLFAGAKTVPQGYNFTIERFGKYTRTLKPGLNLIVPFIDTIGKKMNVMEQVLDVPHQEVITRDNATVTANGVTFYQILDAASAAYEVTHLEHAILNLTMTNIRSVMGSMDLDELLSHRDQINEKLLRVVDTAVAPWGIKITRIEIKDIDPPKDLVDSMGRQMKAEREKRATILEAEGRRQAAFRDAEARERSAEAEAKATQLVSDAIASGNVQAINYFVANNYIKALESIASSPNQKLLMLPIEAASVIGAIGGIAEIARETFGGDTPAPARPSSRPPSSTPQA
jgi:regulator of protease activity HflC (stomatin/prohibitin superfamily)